MVFRRVLVANIYAPTFTICCVSFVDFPWQLWSQLNCCSSYLPAISRPLCPDQYFERACPYKHARWAVWMPNKGKQKKAVIIYIYLADKCLPVPFLVPKRLHVVYLTKLKGGDGYDHIRPGMSLRLCHVVPRPQTIVVSFTTFRFDKYTTDWLCWNDDRCCPDVLASVRHRNWTNYSRSSGTQRFISVNT